MPLTMGSQAVDSGLIPGLQEILTEKHLKRSRDIRNNLLKESKDEDRDEHINFLLWLLKDCGVQDIFGIVDVHSHFDVPRGSHMVTKIEGRNASFSRLRTEPAQDKDLEPELCGHKFVYIPELGWYPYEFRLGPLLDTNEAYSKFFSRFSNYLDQHNITSLGFEYTIPQVFGITMCETVSKKEKHMVLEKISPSLRLSKRLLWVPTCWRCSTKSKDKMGVEGLCTIDPDTYDHDPPKPKPKQKDLATTAHIML
ncbi:hypothetical protein FOQG_18968 [Fusarium oxysporum f. sp. raphani 54005]|uniref:Uncharacterized protein n=1 Tax=Fusarium oxysporum f. sp. raphani 54005 TaxID=1089458 RepID=X0B2F2_FUSOX|nr:hypothetical protein FOQG_18968 [Fusarium oxysporum f. sp. raphani 54005]